MFGELIRCSCNPILPWLGIPALFQGCSFETFDLKAAPGMERALDLCRRVACGEAPSAFLYSQTKGVGKTHLLVATIAEWRLSGRGASFWVGPDLLAYLRQSIQLDLFEKIILELGRADFLLGLDDLGAHKATEWAEEQLFRVLNRRYNELAPTIITSNVAIEMIDERLRSRFSAGLVICEGKDYRGRR